MIKVSEVLKGGGLTVAGIGPMMEGDSPRSMPTNFAYLLTSGNFEDYTILGVFTTEELANKAKPLYPDSRVEKHSLDLVPDHPPGKVAWEVFVFSEDRVEVSQVSPNLKIPYEVSFLEDSVKGKDSVAGEDLAKYIVRCWASGEEQAKKTGLAKFIEAQAAKEVSAV